MILSKKIESVYKNKIVNRCDNPLGIFYFSHEDFEDLEMIPFAFMSSLGHKLQGYFYFYPNYDKNRFVIFDHGFGNGHRAYMKEIEKLCKAGFLVFSYDHTGCMASEGKNTGGFCQSLVDLNDCVQALKSHEMTKSLQIMVVGHSWGAFSTLNIPALHPDITHIVAISGFLSVDSIINQNFTGLLSLYRKSIHALEASLFGKFVAYDAVSSLKSYEGKVLAIYSDNDSLVKKSWSYDVLYKYFGKKDNFSFILEKNKAHNPNYTYEAIAYMGKFFKELSLTAKQKLLVTKEQQEQFMSRWDWNKMTEQDDVLWNRIVNHLQS
ncbi:MAG: alpha/beta hydrolase [Spirochaetaceae bacterium]|nr:alpha/beta hydrolase [Spirochaetaceae bacterium]